VGDVASFEKKRGQIKTNKEYSAQLKRVDRIMDERRDDFVEELTIDYQEFIHFLICQLSDEELYNARGLRIKYSVSGGKLKREGNAFVQTLSVVMDPIFGADRVFGNYEDFYSAFRKFLNPMRKASNMFKVDPIPPRFTQEDAVVEVFVYFDHEK
jgi:hypothetical protein